jgi:hypothetical protein
VKGSPYRSGPWPGLTPRGAAILLACAVFLAIGQLLIGPLHQPLPDLPLLGVASLMPLAIAERIVKAPGAATAVSGAYLLPRATISLLIPTVPPPPQLLVPAIAFDLALWLDASHLVAVRDLWPRRRQLRRRRPKSATRPFSRGRALIAGGVFGFVLSAVESGFQVFLGADPRTWTGPDVWLAGAITTLVCAALATIVSAPDTAS